MQQGTVMGSLASKLKTFASKFSRDPAVLSPQPKEYFLQVWRERFRCSFLTRNAIFKCLCLFQIYELRVMETKPDKAVSIIECDMNVS